MADILLIHGTWTGGWIWTDVRRSLAARGHNVLAPTLTGLGEREHLLTGETGLDTHVEDLLAVVRWESLQDILLVGHSYGGMLVSALADRLPGTVAGVILMNAALPRDGETMLDMQTPDRRDQVLKIAAADGQGYLVPKRMLLNTGITDKAAADSFAQRSSDHPLRSLTQPLSVGDGLAPVGHKLHLIADHASERFRKDHEWAAAQADWQTGTLGSSHYPMATVPEATASLINSFSASGNLARDGSASRPR
jgi:pimeloyl-ACP methyl ester carboxylesterase